MELKLGIEVIASYKRLAYKVWYALAEYVDNSTQSYINNKEALDKAFETELTKLTVEISYSNDKINGFVQIKDNSIGMDENDLASALTVGKRPIDTTGRSKYGLGLKTASFWFGDKWEIITKKKGCQFEYTVIADLQNLISNNLQRDGSMPVPNKSATSENGEQLMAVEDHSNKLDFKVSDPLDVNLHYTIVKITKLNRNIAPGTSRKTKDFLRSIYRVDLQNENLVLIFQGEHLKWDKKQFTDRMLKDESDMPYHTQLSFEVNSKNVHGWAGVLETGSRRDAGFSILQANRVIQGWPDGYRPPKLFGDQEGGTNNLVNQRLIGELYLDGFDVSHTKDEILFGDDEEEMLDNKLYEALAHFKIAAENYRKPVLIADQAEIDYTSLVSQLFQEIKSPEIESYVKTYPVLPVEIIHQSNEEVYERSITSEDKEIYETEISGIKITVIINGDGSIYDPYVLIRARASKDEIVIVVNKKHQHWSTLKSPELILYFIRHCILDGLAEWKANFVVHDLDPDTIKTIKDSYLRLNFDII